MISFTAHNLGGNCLTRLAGRLSVMIYATLGSVFLSCSEAALADTPDFRVATFQADITIPIGHACMGGGVADAKQILDPLFAKGFVLLGAGEPIVLVALDWCQCNNDSYDHWRSGLAARSRGFPGP